MNERELVLWLCDEFHDWIDGDDPVEFYNQISADTVHVKFESGETFSFQVTKIYE